MIISLVLDHKFFYLYFSKNVFFTTKFCDKKLNNNYNMVYIIIIN